MTFCCHDLYQRSSGLLAVTWRLREVIPLHSPVTVTKSRLLLDPRLNTQALVYSQHGDYRNSIPPFPQRSCWQLHHWGAQTRGAHTWGVTQTGVAQTSQHLPYLSQPKGLQCPLHCFQSFTVFPFSPITNSLGPWLVFFAPSTMVMEKKRRKVLVTGFQVG